MRLRRPATLVLPAVLALLVVAAPAPLLAQGNALDRVEELARTGRTDEAREALTAWFDANGNASRADLQRGLWLRGRLTVDPSQAELDFQRIVVLYPSSTYAPQALFRLAQSAFAQGDAEAARRHVATLARDYPTAPSRAQAEAWMRDAGPPPEAAPSGPRTRTASADGTATAPAPTTQTPRDTTATGIRPSAGRPAAPADLVQDWFVQFGAFADEERAFALHQELVTAGLAARLVRVQGSGFLHVRIGRFADRASASRQLEVVEAGGFTAAIVRDDRPEEVVRR